MSITRPWFSRKINFSDNRVNMKGYNPFFFNKVKIDYQEEGEVRIYRLRMHQKKTFQEM